METYIIHILESIFCILCIYIKHTHTHTHSTNMPSFIILDLLRNSSDRTTTRLHVSLETQTLLTSASNVQ
jgi:hypothetical protein